MARAILRTRNQFTLPEKIRELSRARVGDVFDVSFESGRIVLSHRPFASEREAS
jgi:bifunctional DNA-binding transcriptional regulator/antitoxin component of YhaV-PrlF toxin-antitoxin module